ncbi:hypothetical protein B5F07_21930 [Lachnoclostridium sp. An169]|uniref:ATP-binding protein n=1 Tax=Lachnoclostridium sp. An169 TaxID=1965569 RepID=UPI000B37CB5A|nr:DUF87 domain-containing protein [Lachnoclostridium sp. An169]OUP79513.1 hypothetical protein B5F07_21930 [Lachnoclostridium sp. An169]
MIISEKNEILLLDKPNGHLLVLGMSGVGKTFFLCRKMEDEVRRGKRVLIFDYAASFTDLELGKNQFQVNERVRVINPMETELPWPYRGSDLPAAILNALTKSLNIQSYYQKKLLKEVLSEKEICNERGGFSFPKLMLSLEYLSRTKEDADSVKNVGHLLTRIAPYEDIKEVKIIKADEKNVSPAIQSVTILQLSDYPELKRKFLTEFLTELFWQEVREGKKRADIVLFDEFQNLSLKPGSALSAILREGRKFDLAAYLSSQFLGNYDKEAVDTLMQAGNMLFFRPVPRDVKYVADMIDPGNKQEWVKMLGMLQVGQAVLKGTYMINQNRKECETPIICNIVSRQ